MYWSWLCRGKVCSVRSVLWHIATNSRNYITLHVKWNFVSVDITRPPCFANHIKYKSEGLSLTSWKCRVNPQGRLLTWKITGYVSKLSALVVWVSKSKPSVLKLMQIIVLNGFLQVFLLRHRSHLANLNLISTWQMMMISYKSNLNGSVLPDLDDEQVFFFLLTCLNATLLHLVCVVHTPSTVTPPCIICGWAWNASQLTTPVPFVPKPVSRVHTSNPRVVTDWTHIAEGEWTRENSSPWLIDTWTWT